MDAASIDVKALPEDERNAGAQIWHNLHDLSRLIDDFRYSLELYLFAHGERGQENQLFGGDRYFMFFAWERAAARMGAMSAYAFERIMETINRAKAPTLWAKADMNERDAATKLFAAEFPTIAGIRTSAAHPAEFSKDAQQMAKHQATGPTEIPGVILGDGSSVFVGEGMNAIEGGLVYSSTFKGRAVSYELSVRTIGVLERVCDHYNRTFYPLEHPTAAARREQLQRNDGQPR